MKISSHYLIKYFFLSLIYFGVNANLQGQSFYIATSAQEIYTVDIASCDANLVTSFNYMGGTNMNDIAFHPDGTLYGITGNGDLITINTTSGATNFVMNVPKGSQIFTSLISDGEGNLYAADREGRLIKIDPSIPSSTNLGTISPGNGAAGDLSFNGGDLYMASEDNTLVKVNISNPGSSTTVASFPASADDVFGVVSVFTTCTQITTYAMTNTGILKIEDINTGNTSPSCDFGSQINGSIYGGAAVDEAEASECGLTCDLDVANASSSNYSTAFPCATGEISIVMTGNVEITSTSAIDNIVVSLGGILDAGDETLVFNGAAPAGITVAPSSGTSMTLTNSGVATVDDFETALAQISYTNDDGIATTNPTKGTRTINLRIQNTDATPLVEDKCKIEIDVDCLSSVNIDLDDVPAGNNYSGEYDCSANEFRFAPDPVFSPSIIDSFVIEITAGKLDGTNEFIVISEGRLDKSVDGNGAVTLVNNLGAGAVAIDFTQALRNAKYVNNAPIKSKGKRTITVTGYLNGSPATILAIATVEIEGPDAGKFNSETVCETGDKIDLFDYARPAFPPDDQLGSWTLGYNGTPLASGTDEFDPATDISGRYYYTLLNDCNVEDTASMVVTVISPQSFDAIPDDTFYCAGSSVLINGTTQGATSYKWTDDINGLNEISAPTSTFTAVSPGTYYLFVELNSCILMDEIVVTELPNGVLDVAIIDPPDTDVFVLCEDQSVSLTAQTSNASGNDPIIYKWSNGSNQTTTTADDSSTYIITVRQGCNTGSDSITIQMEDCSCPIFVPNAFNPLSLTTTNSFFYPITDGCETFSRGVLTIFDRWGEKVHEGDQDNPWYGAGFPLDTYAWHFSYTYRDAIDPSKEIEAELKGFVILVK